MVVIAYAVVLLAATRLITGVWIPESEDQRTWFVTGLTYFFVRLLTNPWFQPPRDAFVNAFATFLLLVLLDLRGVTPLETGFEILRWTGVGLAVLTMVAAAIAMLASDRGTELRRQRLGYIGYYVANHLGRAEAIFGIPIVLSTIAYYAHAPAQAVGLLTLWLAIFFLRPIELLFSLAKHVHGLLAEHSHQQRTLGTLLRVDSPNILRIDVQHPDLWDKTKCLVVAMPDGSHVYSIPIGLHTQEARVLGTALAVERTQPSDPAPVAGTCYTMENAPLVSRMLLRLSGCPGEVKIVGFVVENSEIGRIRFECVADDGLEEGMIVFCRLGDEHVYYQIINATTHEEVLEQNPRGRLISAAVQLGTLSERGFTKYGWVPSMNAPVFMTTEVVGVHSQLSEDEMELGKIPGSQIGVRLSIKDLIGYHGALLGVTGTGKTELAFDIICKALAFGAKVFCVDLTGEYKLRLAEFNPWPLAVQDSELKELGEKLFAVDTGRFGAPEEKKQLREYLDGIAEGVWQRVDAFLQEPGGTLGLFELPEIANDKATLRVIELYLSSIMRWAKANRKARRVLIVLEEAHTTIPETVGSGFDYDTQWVVGRIAQIALQGRKYGVGLLVISQRTALVSKSILSQCHTYITFSLLDKTSLDYLTNVYSAEHVQALPNLKFLQALAYGKAVRSERPVLVQIAYDSAKEEASKRLDKTLATPKDQTQSPEAESEVAPTSDDLVSG